ncbi:MAG TPA: polysaccharide deacetylase family protein [Polyangiaceae bacterium]|jgi:peptidoglycan/xylan/chitin deacetylase (PgdA/CDA1 family)
MNRSVFRWPAPARAAVSLSFDDARPSQLDCGVSALDSFGVKATFYVSIGPARARSSEWAEVSERGHEIGNHSKTHPCSGNFEWVERPLEDMTLDDMERELLEANRAIGELAGITPKTFAYPCGQSFVGRGCDCQSYVPLVARHFEVGRAAFSETDNNPERCDLAAVASSNMDRRTWSELEQLLKLALQRGRWLVLTGHEIGPQDAHQTTRLDTLRRFCEFAAGHSELWVGTVLEVGRYVHSQRGSTNSGA